MSARIEGLTWRRSEFCSGWLITGAPGSGKTQFLECLLHQLFRHETGRNVRGTRWAKVPFGGLILEGEETFESTLLPMARHYGRQADLKILATRPTGAREGWIPPVTFNLLSDERVPAMTYAEVIARASMERGDADNQSPSVRALVIRHLAWAIELMRSIRACQTAAQQSSETNLEPALDLICKILTSYSAWKNWLSSLGLWEETNESRSDGFYCYERYDSPELRAALSYFRDAFWGAIGAEQQDEVQCLLRHFIGGFMHREMAEVFCRGNTFEFEDIDRGVLVSIAMPRPFDAERRCVSALLKQVWWAHVLRRVDLRRENRLLGLNLSVLFQDDAPYLISKIDQAIETMRLADATTVIATQSQSISYADASPSTGSQCGVPLILRNRFILRSDDQACAAASARFVGKRAIREFILCGVSLCVRLRTKYWVEPQQLLELEALRGILVHRNGRWKSICFQPLTAEGRRAGWAVPLEPWALKLRRWLRRSKPTCPAPSPRSVVRAS